LRLHDVTSPLDAFFITRIFRPPAVNPADDPPFARAESIFRTPFQWRGIGSGLRRIDRDIIYGFPYRTRYVACYVGQCLSGLFLKTDSVHWHPD